MPHKILSSAGFGNSGSSAVTNFFEEFSNVKVVGSSKFECTFLHESDGLIDLKNSLFEGNRLKTDLAIKRFLSLAEELQKNEYKNYFNGKFLSYTKEYISSLNLCTWKGGWHRAEETKTINLKDKLRRKAARLEYEKLSSNSEYKLYEADNWHPQYVPYCTQYYKDFSIVKSSDKNSFYKLTKQYLSRLFDECDLENKYEYLSFDQLLPSNASEEYFKLFDFIKVVVVDRDPRDLYFGNKVFWGNRFFPSKNPYIFIDWYKQTRTAVKKISSNNLIYITLEELVFDYNSASKKIIKFTCLSEKKHTEIQKYFTPSKSITNLYLWQRYILSDKEYSERIINELKIIEKNLSNFCWKKYPPLKEEEIQIQSKFIEKLIQTSDNLIDRDNLSLSQRLCFIYNSLRHDFCNFKLIHNWNWFLKLRNKNFRSSLFFSIKSFIYVLYLPFEAIVFILTAIIQFFII